MEKDSVHIFLVDDDPFYLNILRQHLNNLGYTYLTTFDNGIGCLNSLDQQPDIIFLEPEVDRINGLEILKKIKRFNPDIYVVFVSAQENLEASVNSLKYGSFDYIIKGENEMENIKKVLNNIKEVKELLKNAQPNFIKKMLSHT